MVNYSPNVALFINNEQFIFWEQITVKRRMKAISSIEILFPNRFGQFTNSFTKDQSVVLLVGWEENNSVFWNGKIDNITRSADKHGNIKLWCRDPARIYEMEKTVDDDFEPYVPFGGTHLQLMQLMNQNISIPLLLAASASSTDFSITKDFGIIKNTLQEFIDAANVGGYEWFYSGLQERLVIRAPRELIEQNKVKTFILGDPNDHSDIDLSNFAFLINDSVDEDFSDTYNRIRADGPEGSNLKAVIPPAQIINPREQNIQNDSWNSQNAVQQAAQNYFDNHRFGRISVNIGILHGQENIEVGDIIFCDDAFYGLSLLPNKLFRIIEITDVFNKGGWNSQFSLGDFTPTLSDFL